MAYRTRTPLRTVGAVLRALLGLALLVALVGGAPSLLLTVGHQPTELSGGLDLLMRQDDGTLFLVVLTCIGWTAWAAFTLSVAVEIVAMLRRRSAPRIRGLGGMQSLAGFLIGGIVLLAPTAAAAATTSPAIAATAVQSTGETASSLAPRGSADRAAEEGNWPTHTVASTSELPWDLAEKYLGDGTRWRDIAALNPTIGQLAAGDEFLPTGAVIKLPADARPVAPATSTSSPTPGAEKSNAPTPQGGAQDQAIATTRGEGDAGQAQSHTVREGDSLWSIADKHGDPTDWPRIYEANKGKAQPGGGTFDNPNLIYPGQVLDLPAAATGGPDAHGSEPDQGQADQPGKQPDSQADTPAPDTDASPSQGQPSDAAQPDTDDDTREEGAGQPAATPTPSPTTSAPTAPATNTPPTERTSPAATSTSDDTLPTVALASGIGALLAATLAGALGVKRILQQRRRRAGETIAIDPDPTQLEQVLNAAGEPGGAALLDSALRTLAHNATAAGGDLPALRGARVGDRTVQLIPDDPQATPLPPFTSGKPGTWVLDPSAPLLDSEETGNVPAPYPALVTLGATDDGDLLLADLLHTRALLLDGDAGDVLAVARAMTLEAGTSSWSDHTEIVTVGLGTRLATLLPKGRIQTMPHLPSVAADLGALLVETYQHSGDPNDAPEPLPWILICAGDVDAENAWQLADAVSAARHLPITVVLPAGEATRQAFPQAEQIPVAPDLRIALSSLGIPVQLQRLTDDQYRQYVHALEVADQDARPATGAWQLAEDHDLAATEPRPAPHPLLLHHGGEDTEVADPANPFPALLASAEPSQIRLVEPSTEADIDAEGDGSHPEGDSGADASAEALHEDAGEDGDDPDAPEIAVLGPLRVTGITNSGHGPKVAALAALIYLRPGRAADALCTAMDPVSPWSKHTLQSRLSELRSRLGTTPDGEPYLPRMNKTGYVLHPAVRSDWARFQRLAARGLAAGSDAGIADLENALGLVRDKPFAGQENPWAESVQQDMLSRIIDVAHTLATWHADGDHPDLDAARQAALRGLDIDETAEVLYRDWMHIEWTAQNTTGVRKAVARVQQITRTYDISMEPLTEQTIDLVLSDRQAPAHAGGA
ncbi:LysM peptidoglycan-binding domain-containing protein [Streptomyces sp. NBC_01619]|uniref:LysM peptidoglycan-binding domain-containing protein n=1 Tax=Streptomyces sp. NBC_01619 TaxID=2975901 RepID=UPI0022517FF2|nr:LysM peptidoglycan-binding domain-containing protein [Streptomyces sp. NBC_01619]MCX4515951.1 LysM peptidoglycan-binding domain-containing protein [Streptomyces sp. NBC_01619]